jgi:hypothetical protein
MTRQPEKSHRRPAAFDALSSPRGTAPPPAIVERRVDLAQHADRRRVGEEHREDQRSKAALLDLRKRADFDDGFAGGQQIQRLVECGGKNRLQIRVRDVAACHPNQLRRRTEALNEANEIAVFADQNAAALLGFIENIGISRVSEPQVPQRKCSHAEVLLKPRRKGRWKLGIQPDLALWIAAHAARRGKSTRFAAKRRAADISSGSRSGKSARIAWALTPSASISRISLTRMRMPRMQGRPPHCAGLKVMRASPAGSFRFVMPIRISYLPARRRAVRNKGVHRQKFGLMQRYSAIHS